MVQQTVIVSKAQSSLMVADFRDRGGICTFAGRCYSQLSLRSFIMKVRFLLRYPVASHLRPSSGFRSLLQPHRVKTEEPPVSK